MLILFWFLLSAAAIYAACEYFVNGVEWLGRRLRLGTTAVGSVLAALGTALPESAVTGVAVFSGHGAHSELGIGAALGGPLVLATLGYAWVGLVLWQQRRRLARPNHVLDVDGRRLAYDQRWFLLIFGCKCLLGLVTFAYKPWLGVFFLLAYLAYLWRELRGNAAEELAEALEPLRLRPVAEPGLGWILLQSVAALLLMIFAVKMFVRQMDAISAFCHWPAQLTALFLSPVATELPELASAIIWIRQGRERLALANIAGSMMIQATIPSALAIFATPWRFDTPALLAALITALAIAYAWLICRRSRIDARELVPLGGLYLLFAVLVLSRMLE